MFFSWLKRKKSLPDPDLESRISSIESELERLSKLCDYIALSQNQSNEDLLMLVQALNQIAGEYQLSYDDEELEEENPDAVDDDDTYLN